VNYLIISLKVNYLIISLKVNYSIINIKLIKNKPGCTTTAFKWRIGLARLCDTLAIDMCLARLIFELAIGTR